MKDIIYSDERTKQKMFYGSVLGVLAILFGLLCLFLLFYYSDFLKHILHHYDFFSPFIFLLGLALPIYGIVIIWGSFRGEAIIVDHELKQIIHQRIDIFSSQYDCFNISDIRFIKYISMEIPSEGSFETYYHVILVSNQEYIIFEEEDKYFTEDIARCLSEQAKIPLQNHVDQTLRSLEKLDRPIMKHKGKNGGAVNRAVFYSGILLENQLFFEGQFA